MKDRRVTQAKNRSSEFVNAKGAKIAVGLRDIVSGSWIVRVSHFLPVSTASRPLSTSHGDVGAGRHANPLASQPSPTSD